MFRLISAALLFAGVLAATPFLEAKSSHGGHNDNDRVSFGSDITVDAEQKAGDIACAFCSVHLHGDVTGDVAVFMGNVTIDQDRTVSGDVAVLGGDVSVADNAVIGGDLALAAGDLKISPDGTIHGDRVVFPGRFWLVLPFAPLLILAGVIWLIVWLVRRNRYGSPYYRR